jgi:Domain of unknown function (DUF6265)
MLLVTLAWLVVTAPSVNDVGWIAGCWDLTRDNRHIVEQWMPPEGNTMLGMSRTVVDGKTTEWEFLMIRGGPKGLEYVAKPSGQPEAVFTATAAASSEVVFESPAHDFPKKIMYARSGESLVAAIEGPMNGKTRRIEFPYKKVACGSTR